MKKLLLYVVFFTIVVAMLYFLKFMSESRFTFKTISPYDPSGRYDLEKFDMMPFPDAGPYVNLYTQPSNTGTYTTISKSANSLPVQNILSFDLGPYTRATFYNASDFRGGKGIYENNRDFVLQVPAFNEQQLQNEVGSVKVEILNPYAIVYSQQNLGGTSKIMHGNVPTLDSTWQNNIVSMIVSPFSKVTLFSQPGYLTQAPALSKEYVNSSSTPMVVKYVGSQMASAIMSLKTEQLFRADQTSNNVLL